MTNEKVKKTSTAKKIAKGAAGVAITAGVVAAGAALSSKSTRKQIVKGTAKAISVGSTTIKKAIDEAERLDTASHTLMSSENKSTAK